ncbi:MAG: methyltransferase domain-containing protein [Solirubrobacterales bacterium]|nr:methyltransferase domain-containing protein [Solirubrobacterales bacterium]
MKQARRLSFGKVAELYDRTRPSYPAALVEELIALAGLGQGERLLEVGAGTGKATLMFASRGVPVLAIEPSAEMAAVARRNCAPYLGVSIVESDFERWRPAGERFPLLYSAQAWHWIAPEVRFARARQALPAGGSLAAFWNRVDWSSCELHEELQAAYRRAAPEFAVDGPMHPAGLERGQMSGQWMAEIADEPQFESPAVEEFPWTCEYSTEEYVALLRTHSDHHLLEQRQREALLAAVAEVLDCSGGVMRVPYETQLCLARAR